MGNGNKKNTGGGTAGRSAQAARRPPAWERREAARRERFAAHIPGAPRPARTQSGGPEAGPQNPGPQNPGPGAGRSTADAEGVQRVASSATAEDARTGRPYHAEAKDGGRAGGAGDAGSARAEAEARAEAQRAAAAAREQPLYAFRQAAGAIPPEPVDAPEESVDGGVSIKGRLALANAIGTSAIMASHAMAEFRSAKWGPHRGDFWAVSSDEAAMLGDAWAAVIAEFAPVEMIGGGAVLVVAIGVTGMTIIPRVTQDATASREWREQQQAAQDAFNARADAQAQAA
jgi:hypothetical protein